MEPEQAAPRAADRSSQSEQPPDVAADPADGARAGAASTGSEPVIEVDGRGPLNRSELIAAMRRG